MSTKNRIEPIDTWRAFAALGVVWIHCWGHFGNPSLKFLGIDFFKLVAVIGNGVDFFFVISGFCLYMVWINKPINTNTYISFIKKRWLRIAPAFYAAAIIIALYIFFQLHTTIAIPLIGNFLFIQNLSLYFNISPPFWSLAVEFHFYMLLPLFLLYANKNFIKATFIVFIVGNILLFVFSQLQFYYQLQTKVNHFLAGIIVAYLFFQRKDLLPRLNKIYLFIVGIAVLFVGRFLLSDNFAGDHAKYQALFKVLGTNMLVFGFALAMLVTILNTWLYKIFSNKVGLFFGKLSYSIYLWHSFIIMLITKFFGAYFNYAKYNPIILFLISTIILVPVSYVSYELFEKIYFKKSKKEVSVKHV